MSKGLVLETTFMTKSGQGTPMFSRPGKGTCTEYMVFKEPHKTSTSPIVEEKPEEALQEHLKNDLLGKEEDVFGAFIKDLLDKDEEEIQRKKKLE